MKEMEKIEEKISDIIKSEIGVRANITLVEPDYLPRSEGKAVRVIDGRNFN